MKPSLSFLCNAFNHLLCDFIAFSDRLVVPLDFDLDMLFWNQRLKRLAYDPLG